MKTSTKDMERITGMSEKFNTDNTFREFITTEKIAYNRGRGQRYRKYTTVFRIWFSICSKHLYKANAPVDKRSR